MQPMTHCNPPAGFLASQGKPIFWRPGSLHREKSSDQYWHQRKYKQRKKECSIEAREVGIQNDGSEAAFVFFTHLTAIGKFLINAYCISVNGFSRGAVQSPVPQKPSFFRGVAQRIKALSHRTSFSEMPLKSIVHTKFYFRGALQISVQQNRFLEVPFKNLHTQPVFWSCRSKPCPTKSVFRSAVQNRVTQNRFLRCRSEPCPTKPFFRCRSKHGPTKPVFQRSRSELCPIKTAFYVSFRELFHKIFDLSQVLWLKNKNCSRRIYLPWYLQVSPVQELR